MRMKFEIALKRKKVKCRQARPDLQSERAWFCDCVAFVENATQSQNQSTPIANRG
jgi:hypothetical protein